MQTVADQLIVTDCVGNFISLRNFTKLQWQVKYVRFHCISENFKDKLIWPLSESGLDFIGLKGYFLSKRLDSGR